MKKTIGKSPALTGRDGLLISGYLRMNASNRHIPEKIQHIIYNYKYWDKKSTLGFFKKIGNCFQVIDKKILTNFFHLSDHPPQIIVDVKNNIQSYYILLHSTAPWDALSQDWKKLSKRFASLNWFDKLICHAVFPTDSYLNLTADSETIILKIDRICDQYSGRITARFDLMYLNSCYREAGIYRRNDTWFNSRMTFSHCVVDEKGNVKETSKDTNVAVYSKRTAPKLVIYLNETEMSTPDYRNIETNKSTQSKEIIAKAKDHIFMLRKTTGFVSAFSPKKDHQEQQATVASI